MRCITVMSRCSSGTASSAMIWTVLSWCTAIVPLLTAARQRRHASSEAAPKNFFCTSVDSKTLTTPGLSVEMMGTWCGRMPKSPDDDGTFTCATGLAAYRA